MAHSLQYSIYFIEFIEFINLSPNVVIRSYPLCPRADFVTGEQRIFSVNLAFLAEFMLTSTESKKYA